MMVLTVQDYPVVKKILEGSYYPQFMLSSYACSSTRFTKAYAKVLLELSHKTEENFSYGLDSCMWGWCNYPYMPLHKSNGLKGYAKRKYGIFCEVPESTAIFSNYDAFCGYIEGYFDNPSRFLLKRNDYDRYVQCSFWRVNPNSIQLIVDLDNLQRNMTVEELYETNKLRDVRYLFDSRVANLLYA